MFSSLKVRDFRIYWFGMLVSLSGTWIQSVAQSWLVFDLTKSAFLLGVVGFLGIIPVFFLSLLGGILADRVDKRKVLIFTQSAFMLLAFLLAFLTQFKLITPHQIMLIALLNGTVMAFDAPSRQAIVVELAGKDNIFNVVALNSVAFNSSRIIGPALAGILIATIGMSGCFYINGISYLSMIVALFLIRVHNKREVSRKNVVSDLREGFIFIKGERQIIILLGMVGIVSLFGFNYIILMPIFAGEILKAGVEGLGILMSSNGFGALVGALALARSGRHRYKGSFIILFALFFSVSLVLFSLSRSYLLSALALVFVGGSSVVCVALISTILQIKVKDEFRGRVMGVVMLTFAGFIPLGNLISGWLAQALGAPFTVMFNGIICAAFFFIINILYPEIRDII